MFVPCSRRASSFPVKVFRVENKAGASILAHFLEGSPNHSDSYPGFLHPENDLLLEQVENFFAG